MKSRLPNTDILLIAACLCGLFAYLLHLVPDDQAQFILAVIAFAGLVPVLVSAFMALIKGQVTVDLLASVALIFSLINREWTSAVFINLMLSFARIFSAYTENGIRQAVKYLLKLRPQQARIKAGNKYLMTSVDRVKVGDILLVELGERIPADGIVISGAAEVDQSSFTGESLPVGRTVGSQVLGSTIVVGGNIEMKAEKVGADSAFEHVIALVESAQNNKSRITGIADKFAAVYIISILVISILLYLSTGNLNLILSVLLVVCADDIAVAIPLSMTAALSYAARNGVIIKGANFLEGMGAVRTMLMDKTGTLTQGRLRVAGFQTLSNSFAQPEILEMAAGLASQSAHPVSKAVVDYVKALKLPPVELENFSEIGGQGLIANYKHKHVFLGRPSYLAELDIQPTAHQQQEIAKFVDMGYNVTVVVYAKKLAGMFTVRDEIKPEASEAIIALKRMGIKDIVMLTGDNERIAKQVSQRAEIPHFKAGLLPQDKLVYLKARLTKRGKLAMVGDGVNDAPALALADIGIAMGAMGSDVAIESADIVIMQDNLLKIPQIVTLSKEIRTIAKQNFAYWGITNIIGLALVFGGVFTPAAAAAYNFATDFITIFNAMKILRSKAFQNSPGNGN